MKFPRKIPIWLFVAGIGLVAALPLWHDGFLNKRIIGETPYLLMRIQQLYTELQAGVFPVRWMPDGAYGMGYPFFNFYAALPFYVAAGLRFLGFGTILSIKLTQTASFVIGALAMYYWLRRHLQTHSAAVLAAALFTFAPMHLINIYTRGDSLSEFWAMSMYPLVLWAVDKVIEHPARQSVAYLALSYAALLLSHNISGLIFTPLIVLYALWRLLPRYRSWRRVTALVLAGFLGLALSVWFLAPALLERSTIRMEGLLEGFFDWHNNFLDTTLVQPGFLMDYSLYPYRLGLWQTAVTLTGIVGIAILFITRRTDKIAKARRMALWGLVALALSVAMTLSLSSWAYEHLPLLAYMQFPWRWLSVVALTSAVVGAYAIEVWNNHRFQITLSIVLILLTAYSALATLHPEFFPLTEAEITPARLNEAEYFSGDIGTTVRAEYLPTAVHPRPISGPAILGENLLKVLDGQASGERLNRGTNSETWHIVVTGDQAVVAVPTLYWQGWQATLENGTPLSISALDGLGWIQIAVPPGDHTITVELRETPGRWLADAASGLALLIWLALIARPSLAWLRTPLHGKGLLVGLAAAIVLSFILHLWPSALPVGGPQASQFETASYRHAYLGGIVFKNGARLLDYDYSTVTNAGDTLAVQLHWEKPTPSHIEVIPAPVNFWKYNAALATGSDENGSGKLSFTIPPQAAPGLYFVHLSVAGEAYDLLPLRIQTTLQPDPSVNATGTDFGGVLRLEDISTLPVDNGRLNVFLTWQVLKPITRSYGLSVKLRNPAGIELAKHEAMLGVYGTVPAAYWPSRFTDWFSLAGLDGLPPGEGCQLLVTIFDGDRAIGAADLRNIPVKNGPTTPEYQDLAVISSIHPRSANLEQGDTLLIDCTWGTNRGVKVRWILQAENSDQISWETITPLSPGAHLDWWQPRIRYRAVVPLQIPIDLTPGKYSLGWAFVDDRGQTYAPATAPALEEIEIRATTRLMKAPQVANSTNVVFGGIIQLAGYELSQSNDRLSLRLAWRALNSIDRDYTYFVHLQRTDGQTPAAQIDAMPHDSRYPTSLWLPDEYVLDTPELRLAGLPAGEYDVWLGWYNPINGERLKVADTADNRYHLARISIQ